VPKFRAGGAFENPHTMSNADLEAAWERDHMQFWGEKDEERRDHVSRMEYEIRKRGI
jgi:hypothetical protein